MIGSGIGTSKYIFSDDIKIGYFTYFRLRLAVIWIGSGFGTTKYIFSIIKIYNFDQCFINISEYQNRPFHGHINISEYQNRPFHGHIFRRLAVVLALVNIFF